VAKNQNIGSLIVTSIWRWSISDISRVGFFIRILRVFTFSTIRRTCMKIVIRAKIPGVLAISPTMSCNYDCVGCYSRDRVSENELSTDEIDKLYKEAENLGISTIVVTGGEPFVRDDTIELAEKHKRLLFVIITNGSFISKELAERISKSRNVITLVSIEGFTADTDLRRKEGAYEAVLSAFDSLRKSDAFYGFAATNTTANSENLCSDKFIEDMTSRGCAVGFLSEYVPCGLNPRMDWVLHEDLRVKIRNKVLKIRREKSIIIIQFPQDEYGSDNTCSAAGKSSIHISSQGSIEPCPFVPISTESIRNVGLIGACKSEFMKAIRKRPGLLKRQKFACALFEHMKEIKKLSENIEKISIRKK
jgi:MoaA/NifB/PqqE/SkfB family radical SAM enzyme